MKRIGFDYVVILMLSLFLRKENQLTLNEINDQILSYEYFIFSHPSICWWILLVVIWGVCVCFFSGNNKPMRLIKKIFDEFIRMNSNDEFKRKFRRFFSVNLQFLRKYN